MVLTGPVIVTQHKRARNASILLACALLIGGCSSNAGSDVDAAPTSTCVAPADGDSAWVAVTPISADAPRVWLPMVKGWTQRDAPSPDYQILLDNKGMAADGTHPMLTVTVTELADKPDPSVALKDFVTGMQAKYAEAGGTAPEGVEAQPADVCGLPARRVTYDLPLRDDGTLSVLAMSTALTVGDKVYIVSMGMHSPVGKDEKYRADTRRFQNEWRVVVPGADGD